MLCDAAHDRIVHRRTGIGAADEHRIRAQVLDKRHHHGQQHEAEGQGGQNGEVLQAGEHVFAAGQQHDDGDAHHAQAPKDDDELIRGWVALGGHGAHDHGGRVSRGDKEDREDDQKDKRGDGAKGKILEHRKEHLFIGGFPVEALYAVLVEGNGGATKDGKGQRQNGGGGEDSHGGEFANGAAAGDAGDEHAHKRRPCNPPGPVERRPVGLEFNGLIAPGQSLGHHGQELIDIGHDARRNQVQQQ